VPTPINGSKTISPSREALFTAQVVNFRGFGQGCSSFSSAFRSKCPHVEEAPLFLYKTGVNGHASHIASLYIRFRFFFR
jgi:hypothetical protein